MTKIAEMVYGVTDSVVNLRFSIIAEELEFYDEHLRKSADNLEVELLTRQMFYKAQEKAGNKRELKKLLNELLDFDSLHTQKDCLHMFHKLIGIERYLLLMPEDADMKRLFKQVELAKKTIGDKSIEFFEKEEGHLYEKIGEGVYQRKR